VIDVESLSRKFQKELNAGTTALVLLALLARRGDALYGYEIAKQLAAVDAELALGKQGALYPVLRALAEWSRLWRRTRQLVDEMIDEPGREG